MANTTRQSCWYLAHQGIAGAEQSELACTESLLDTLSPTDDCACTDATNRNTARELEGLSLMMDEGWRKERLSGSDFES
jgi:hypothetical protein